MSPNESTRRPGPVEIPADMIAFNRKVIKEFRANRGQLSGPMEGRSLMLLTTTGAKSGKERTAVLGFRKDGNRIVAIASGNGAPSHPAWYLNLQARPIATVEVGADKFKVRARNRCKKIPPFHWSPPPAFFESVAIIARHCERSEAIQNRQP